MNLLLLAVVFGAWGIPLVFDLEWIGFSVVVSVVCLVIFVAGDIKRNKDQSRKLY